MFQHFRTVLHVHFRNSMKGKSTSGVGNPCAPHPLNKSLYIHRYTPLMEAAREGHEDVVQLLVEHGANVNAQTEETQETALTLACCGGFMEVVQYLIEHG